VPIAGLNPIAAATDFHSVTNMKYFTVPSVKYILVSQLAIHEYIGTLWAKLIY